MNSYLGEGTYHAEHRMVKYDRVRSGHDKSAVS